MSYSLKQHRRRSLRLKGYDYSGEGAYFITICSHKRQCIFCDVFFGEIKLNELGRTVKNEWLKTAGIRDNVDIDEFIVMPNHLHGIIIINRRGVLPYAITNKLRPPSRTIGAIVRGFKSAATKQINLLRNMPGTPVWQRNYYEHIIRNEESLNRIRDYIRNNPLRWEEDIENPSNWFKDRNTTRVKSYYDSIYRQR